MSKPTEAYYQLSEEERNALAAKSQEVLAKVGGKTILVCSPAWSTEEWLLFGVEEFPDIEAVQEHTELLLELDWLRYLDSTTMLGVQWSPP